MKCNLLNQMKLKKGCMEETGRQEAKKETSPMPMSRGMFFAAGAVP